MSNAHAVQGNAADEERGLYAAFLVGPSYELPSHRQPRSETNIPEKLSVKLRVPEWAKQALATF